MNAVDDTVGDFNTILDQTTAELDSAGLISGGITRNEGSRECGGSSENGESDDGRRTHFV